MATRNNPGTFDCYNAAGPDEPMFILLARDRQAPALIEKWARDRLAEIEQGTRPTADISQCLEALDCAQAMRLWRSTNR